MDACFYNANWKGKKNTALDSKNSNDRCGTS